MSDPIISVKDIDYHYFPFSGDLKELPENLYGSRKFYVIENFNPEKINTTDIPKLITKQTGSFNETYGLVIILSKQYSTSTNIIYSGRHPIYLRVQSSLSLTHSIKGNVHIIGSPLNNKITGNQDNNTLRGGDGNDIIDGDGGHDHLRGDNGHDTLYGKAGYDILIGAKGNDILYGGTQDDTLYGGPGHDNLFGDTGNDSLNGGEGNDVLYGHEGRDWIEGDNGHDTIYGGPGHDELHGNAGDDWLEGGKGNDVLYGHEGQNWLKGGEGNDKLYGSIDNDVYLFLHENWGHDIVNDAGGDNTLIFYEPHLSPETFVAEKEGKDLLIKQKGNENKSIRFPYFFIKSSSRQFYFQFFYQNKRDETFRLVQEKGSDKLSLVIR